MGFRVSIFCLQFPVLWFPIFWLDRVCLLKSSQGQSLHHDLCLDSVENGISSFRLRFTISHPLAWSCQLFEVLSGSEPPSWSLPRFHRNGILSFRLQFTISRSLLSHPLNWLCLSLEVLSASEPPSWSLLRFHRKRDFEFLSLVYDFPFSDFPSSGLIVSVSWSPLRVRASIMIFA